jgi:hypothetical protein
MAEAVAQGKDPAAAVTEFVDANRGLKDTAFAPDDPTVDDLIARVASQETTRNRLRAQLSGLTSITPANIQEAVRRDLAAITSLSQDKKQEWTKTYDQRLTTALLEEFASPVGQAGLGARLDEVLGRLDSALSSATKTAGHVKEEVMAALASVPRPTSAQIEKAIMDASGLARDVVRGAAKPPKGPKGMVFADSNWEDGDQEILFTMVVNPLTEKMEMWQVAADGSGARPMDSNKWVDKIVWEIATDPA